MSTEIRVLDDFFAAINRNDVQAIAIYFDPHVVRIEPEGFPMAGTYRGVDEFDGVGRWTIRGRLRLPRREDR